MFLDKNRGVGRLLVGGKFFAVIFVAACGLVGLVSILGCGNNFNNAEKPLQDEPPPRMVTIQFANLSTTEAVNVDFYLSYERMEFMPNGLFVSGNFFTEGVGVAGTGVIEPRSSDSIEIECTEFLSIGTTGGRFVDGESGESLGVGVPRWLQEGPLAICDGEVTFVYRSEEEGFNTTIVLKN